MIRNPIEMAPALHGDMVLSGEENIIDFRAAWDLQGKRRAGRRLSAFSGLRRRFLYGEVCALGAQLERLLADVPRDLVLVVVLDELSNNPWREYLRVLQFLGVKDDGRIVFPVHKRP